jgi:hypothetical protein
MENAKVKKKNLVEICVICNFLYSRNNNNQQTIKKGEGGAVRCKKQ